MPHLVITGASAGIGAATAELFQNNGFDIVNLSRKPCPVAGVTNIPCDLAQPDFIQKIQNRIYVLFHSVMLDSIVKIIYKDIKKQFTI